MYYLTNFVHKFTVRQQANAFRYTYTIAVVLISDGGIPSYTDFIIKKKKQSLKHVYMLY